MRKLLFWPYQLYFWLVLIPLVVLLTLVFSTLAVLLGVFVSHRAGSRVAGSRWARWIGYATPIRVDVTGAEHMDPAQSYVVVCNHQSMYDIIVVYGWLNLDLKWVMKQELRKVPGIGIGCEKIGHIFIDRKRPERARRALEAALHRLGDGIGILFFAEGTRSLDGRLLPFKKGAFRTAIDTGLPVLPVTVTGTHEIMPAKTLRVFPGRAGMVIHAPIETRGMTPRDVGDLLERTRSAIASALPGEPDPGPSSA